jgi:hypothetical protein
MPTYKLISSVILSAGSASEIEFTSIPATYTDLNVVFSGRCNSGGAIGRTIFLRFNNSASNLTNRFLEATGTSVSGGTSTSGIAGIVPGAASTSSVFSNISIYVNNYTDSNNKSYLVDSVMENNATTVYNLLVAGLWSNSSAIDAIKLITDDGSSFVQYSTAYLYGVSNA